MVQYNYPNSVIEIKDHFKKEAKTKRLIRRSNQFIKSCFLVIFMMLIFFSNVHAQTIKIAVLDFNAGVGIQDVEGMSSTLTTYLFNTQKFTIVERTQVNKVIYEQGFQSSRLTENQMVRIGEILNVQKIVVGDINIINGQYNVDVRILDVQTATMNSGAGEVWSGSQYRDAMQKVAQTLTSKMQFAVSSASSGISTETRLPNAGRVVTIYGYLQVYPTDLGDFSTEPKNVIAGINNSAGYGYNDWRLPTIEELEAMQSNIREIGGMQSGIYMTAGRSYTNPVHVRLVTTGKPIAVKEVEHQQLLAAERERAEAERRRQEEQRRIEMLNKTTDSGVQISGTTWATRNVGNKGTFVNNRTELGEKYYIEDAKNACPNGWRLPTYKEIENLISLGRIEEYKEGFLISSSLFLPTEVGNFGNGSSYWSGENRSFNGKIENNQYHTFLLSGKYTAIGSSTINFSWGDYSVKRCVRCVKQ